MTPKKRVYTTPAPALDLTTSLQSDSWLGSFVMEPLTLGGPDPTLDAVDNRAPEHWISTCHLELYLSPPSSSILFLDLCKPQCPQWFSLCLTSYFKLFDLVLYLKTCTLPLSSMHTCPSSQHPPLGQQNMLTIPNGNPSKSIVSNICDPFWSKMEQKLYGQFAGASRSTGSNWGKITC